MSRILIDGRPYDVDSQHNLLQTCLSLGFNLPYFCWHPALGSVGACRQCAVKQFKDEHDRQGRLVMACMTPAADGTSISIEDQEAKEFRAGVIEWLMANHPHDCPVCDEGGECHLQDMTVMTGHAYRRYPFTKRTFRNQDLGPFITHEMNRCIQCYRCVRFYRDYAGGRDFNAFASRNHVYFGRHEDGVLENRFSGNLIEVCPTGVFDDKTLMPHYVRKWDLQTAPSLCVHCSLGCNTIAGERRALLRRIMNRFNSRVNGYFLCDRGRFGYEVVNSDRRLRRLLARDRTGAPLAPVETGLVMQRLAPLLAASDAVIGIGSPRASLEANFALRTLVGPGRFHTGVAALDARLAESVLEILRQGPVGPASIADVEQADAVLILGEDLINTAPRLALAVRQALRQQPMQQTDRLKIPRWDDAAVRNVTQTRQGPLFIALPGNGSELADVATETYYAAPDDLARFGFAIAQQVDQDAPTVPALPPAVLESARRIADALRNASRPMIISGTGCKSESVIQAAAQVAWALKRKGCAPQLCYSLPECNSAGLALMGGKALEEAFETVGEGAVQAVVILENDLYRRVDPAAVDAFLGSGKQVIVLDHLEQATAAKADVLLPVGTFAETDGTLVNNEGRAQRFYQVFVPDGGDGRESWRWIRDLAAASRRSDVEGMAGWKELDDVVRAMSEQLPLFHRLTEVAPPAEFRLVGQKIPRQTFRASGRTALRPLPMLQDAMHEPAPPDDPDSPLAFSMEGYPGQPPSPLLPHYWAPGWNSVQSLNKFQSEVGGPLREENPGIRLLEPADRSELRYFKDIPKPFQRREGAWLILPLWHIFGSEELSAVAPALAQRIPDVSLALHPDDARKLNLQAGGYVEVTLDGRRAAVHVAIASAVPQGTAGLTMVSEWSATLLPQWSSLTAV